MLNLDLTCFNDYNVKSFLGAFYVGNTDALIHRNDKQRAVKIVWIGCGGGVDHGQ